MDEIPPNFPQDPWRTGDLLSRVRISRFFFSFCRFSLFFLSFFLGYEFGSGERRGPLFPGASRGVEKTRPPDRFLKTIPSLDWRTSRSALRGIPNLFRDRLRVRRSREI